MLESADRRSSRCWSASLVTLVSSLVPALRSTRVPPIAALHAFAPPPTRRRRVALPGALGAARRSAGSALRPARPLRRRRRRDRGRRLVGGGALAIVLAVSLFSPRLVPPLAAISGWPLEKLRRLTGRLARENAQRNPSRTAVTAAALMIGLALVAFVTVFAAGLKSSVAQVVDENFAGGIVIQNTDGFSPIPAGGGDGRREGPRGRDRSRRSARPRPSCSTAASTADVSAPTPNIDEALEIEWKQGGPRDAAPPARRRGGRLRLASPPPTASSSATASASSPRPAARPRFRVVGEFDAKLDVLGSVLVTQPVLARDFGQTQDRIDFVLTAAGRRRRHRSRRCSTKGAEAAFPTAEVLNQQELKESREDQVNPLVALFYVLLGLAVLVSLFGIANTLALSIHERTRELGMLRAIGMSRRQVRTMIRYEAVITALIGAILGMVLGLVFAALIAQPLKDEGFTLSYPVGSLVLLLVFAALPGVLAAIGPARRASRLDVLEALQYE